MVMSLRRSWLKVVALALCSLKSFLRGVRSLRYTINRSQCWITPGGIRIRLSQSVSVAEDLMEKRQLTELPEASLEVPSAKKHFENLLDAKVDLESIVKSKTRAVNSGAARSLPLENTAASRAAPTQSPSKQQAIPKSSKKAKVVYDDDYIDLTYDTKKAPFRHVEPNECSIPNFANVWNAIVDMRQKKEAPVDTMGAHCLADENADPATYEYQTLIACMLSSQTKDAVTAGAMQALKNNGLTMENISKMPEEELDSLISKVGFHKTKAKHIKEATEIILEKFNGRVPNSLSALVSLPGVGPKMANLVLQLAFKRINGIAVDLHVHRIANRLGWVKTNTPEETRIKLQSLIPQKLWAEVNHLLVGFGQTICVAAGPGCATCAANTWCPTGRANLAK
ncbi:base excision DNA repair protein, HhH-GPD family domain containing protein [Babesia divergens]|uniref:Endonuclease III homolog n=1 Tax=Babesia divergens TaxID=32595 RepID=A0AAD9GKS7_BABDI|nr:base excision DNA repair protein, HhH-GPD family domain containing protein [Babesia divergens]